MTMEKIFLIVKEESMKKIEIIEAQIESDALFLMPKEWYKEYETPVAGGQMLVDSDREAFIYLLEQGEEYVYVHIPASIWPKLERANQERVQVKLCLTEEVQLILTNFQEELQYLVGNIKGNGNYGTKLPELIEELFPTF